MKWFLDVLMYLCLLIALWLPGVTNWYLMSMVVIFCVVEASFYMTWYQWFKPWNSRSVAKYVNAHIHYFSFILFIGEVGIVLQWYTQIPYIYQFHLFDMIGNHLHISKQIIPCLLMLGSVITQDTREILLLLPIWVSGAFFLVGCTPCLFMWRWPILLLMDLTKSFYDTLIQSWPWLEKTFSDGIQEAYICWIEQHIMILTGQFSFCCLGQYIMYIHCHIIVQLRWD